MRLPSIPGQQSLFADIDVSPGPVFRCEKCRRPLTSEKSIERGMGLGCWCRHLENMVKNEPEDEPELPRRLPRTRARKHPEAKVQSVPRPRPVRT